MNHKPQFQSPNIHDAYGSFGQKSQQQIIVQSQEQRKKNPQHKLQTLQQVNKSNNKNNQNCPTDASYSLYPVKIKCIKCHHVNITRMNTELGTAAWLWCVLLAPFACVGISCLFIESCKDKIHYCSRCGNVVGKNYAQIC